MELENSIGVDMVTSGGENDTRSVHAEKRVGFGPEAIEVEGDGGVARMQGEAGADAVEVEEGSVGGGGVAAA